MRRIFSGAIWLFAVTQLMAQNTAALGAAGSYAISGTVFGTNGSPLNNAVVTLASASPQESESAQTDTDGTGAFHFSKLAAGTYVLSAAKRGYVSTKYQQHGSFSTGIVTGPGLKTSDLRFELRPWAVIDGTIRDDFGERVPGARVVLWLDRPGTPGSHPMQAGQQTTDDSGTYEFAELRPGTYYLGVTATPWYAFHPPQRRDAHRRLLPAGERSASSLDVVYPMTFYQSATDSSLATPIAVHPGDRLRLNLTLHAVKAVHLTVRIPLPAGKLHFGIQIPQLSQEVFGSDEYVPITVTSTAVENGEMTADYGGLAPGRYVLRSYGQPGGAHTAEVDLAGNQSINYSTVRPDGVRVTGELEMADGESLPTDLRVELGGRPGPAPQKVASVQPDGMFMFPGVGPGEYRLRLLTSDGVLSPVQMAASGAQVQGTRLKVASENVLLAATLARGQATIRGFARRGSQGVGGVMILLAPADPRAGRNLYYRDQSNSDGSFKLQKVVPGDYTLVAIQDGWGLDWTDPQTLAPYLAHGAKLRISAGRRVVTLPNSLPIQKR